ncbi:MAG: hypothetical protein R6V03_10525 [Kiritimatiellia bacterium]
MTQTENSTFRLWPNWWILVPLVVLTISISGESFWIDEITTAWLAQQGSFEALRDALRASGSETQMPVFVFYIWLWAKVFGTSEIALRAANVPWLIIGLLATARLLAQCRCRKSSVLLLCLPILGFYMNESRPYVMTFATAVLTVTAIEGIINRSSRGLLASRTDGFYLAVGMFLCAGASMLNMFLVPALVLYTCLRVTGISTPGISSSTQKKIYSIVKGHSISLLFTAVLLSALGAYYAATFFNRSAVQREGFGVFNLAVTVYEWLGFGGLGAPRNVLRQISIPQALGSYRETLLLGCFAWVLIIVQCLTSTGRIVKDRVLTASLFALFSGGAMLGLAGIIVPASLWGRHFMFLGPFFLAALARITDPGESTGHPLYRRSAFLLLAGVFLLSLARQRCLTIYQKAPYREAVQKLNQITEAQPSVPAVWVGYYRAYDFYSENTGGTESDMDIIRGNAWSEKDVELWNDGRSRYFLLMHRPDVCDPEGSWQSMLTQTENTRLIWNSGGIRIYHVVTHDKPTGTRH